MHMQVEAAASRMLLGDEAVAFAALDAGVTAAYAYPGTPSTEIMETLLAFGGCKAAWCANEKTAYEEALGVSMAGRRAIVAMKHVGLNVAADPFLNSVVVSPIGGLVVAVADDPGMHSSQNEQDSRYYADFAHIPCLEPADPQQAYDMTLEAFEISEHFRIPVMLRLVTRIAHQRSDVISGERRRENDLAVTRRREEWVLLPNFARRQWRKRIDQRPEVAAWAESSRFNEIALNDSFRDLGVITTGLARSYFLDAVSPLGLTPSHLHIGAYPIPVRMVRRLVEHVPQVLLLEEGYPYVERLLRGIVPPRIAIQGRESGAIPPDGELSQEIVRKAIGVDFHSGAPLDLDLPNRPPRLCDGCSHIDAYKALHDALESYDSPIVTSDIGCYTLGALPPLSMGDSCVCMGASIGMAKGAADAGAHPVVAVIGDSTFLHSGITPLIDAVIADASMTVVILDNEVVAMTGTQPTLMPAGRLIDVVRGLGASPDHCHVVEAHPRRVAELEQIFRREIEHPGLSVVIVHRACIEAVKKSKTRRQP